MGGNWSQHYEWSMYFVNKNTCVVSIKLELDIKKKMEVTSPCLLDKKGEGVCLIVKQKRLEFPFTIYNLQFPFPYIDNVPAHLAALLASKKTSHPLTLACEGLSNQTRISIIPKVLHFIYTKRIFLSSHFAPSCISNRIPIHTKSFMGFNLFIHSFMWSIPFLFGRPVIPTLWWLVYFVIV